MINTYITVRTAKITWLSSRDENCVHNVSTLLEICTLIFKQSRPSTPSRPPVLHRWTVHHLQCRPGALADSISWRKPTLTLCILQHTGNSGDETSPWFSSCGLQLDKNLVFAPLQKQDFAFYVSSQRAQRQGLEVVVSACFVQSLSHCKQLNAYASEQTRDMSISLLLAK